MPISTTPPFVEGPGGATASTPGYGGASSGYVTIGFSNGLWGSLPVNSLDGIVLKDTSVPSVKLITNAMAQAFLAADTDNAALAALKLYTRSFSVTTTSTVSVNATDDIVVLNNVTGSATTINLPQVSACAGREKLIFRWDALGGDIVLIPYAGDTIMGRSSWTVPSLADTGGGGSLYLTPLAMLSGWLVR